MTSDSELIKKFNGIAKNNTIEQNQYNKATINGADIRGATNLISKQVKYTTSSIKPKKKSSLNLLIQLYIGGSPTYKYLGQDVYKRTYNPDARINEFLISYYNNNILNYIVPDNDFQEQDPTAIPPISLEQALENDINISSTNGSTLIEYPYSLYNFYIDIIGVNGVKLVAYNLASQFMESIGFPDNCIISTRLIDPSILTPYPNGFYNTGYGYTESEAISVQNYLQAILDLVKSYSELKIINSQAIQDYSSGNRYSRFDLETLDGIPLILPDVPDFLKTRFTTFAFGGFIDNVYANQFSGYTFEIGRRRNYGLIQKLNEPLILEILEFTTSNINPPYSTRFYINKPFEPNLDNIEINLSNLTFFFNVFDISGQFSETVDLKDLPISIDVSGSIFYRLSSTGEFNKVNFSFTYDQDKYTGKRSFGDVFNFQTTYLSYYIVIDSFDVIL